MTTDHSTTLDALRAELDRERARAESLETVNRVQAASLTGLARLAEELRCQVADLHDDALSSHPMPMQGPAQRHRPHGRLGRHLEPRGTRLLRRPDHGHDLPDH